MSEMKDYSLDQCNRFSKEIALFSALTVKELAKELRICPNSAYKLVHTKDFPKFFVGNSIRINREKLQEWMNRESGY